MITSKPAQFSGGNSRQSQPCFPLVRFREAGKKLRFQVVLLPYANIARRSPEASTSGRGANGKVRPSWTIGIATRASVAVADTMPTSEWPKRHGVESSAPLVQRKSRSMANGPSCAVTTVHAASVRSDW